MVAVFIFVLFVVMYFTYSENLTVNEREDYEIMIMEAKTISNSLLSEGVPTDWNNFTVRRIGLISGNKQLNETKIGQLYNMSMDEGRRHFNIMHNYYILAYDKDGDVIKAPDNIKNSSGYINHTTSEQVVRITRIVPYNNALAELVIYVWY